VFNTPGATATLYDTYGALIDVGPVGPNRENGRARKCIAAIRNLPLRRAQVLRKGANRILVGLIIVAIGQIPALAETLPDMAEFSQSICGDIPEAHLTRTSIQGKVEANASLLAKIITGDANVSGSRADEIYKGIPFEKLPDKIPTVSMCKLELERYPIRLYRIHRPQNSLCIRRV
jgi:hypothetical protein